MKKIICGLFLALTFLMWGTLRNNAWIAFPSALVIAVLMIAFLIRSFTQESLGVDCENRRKMILDNQKLEP